MSHSENHPLANSPDQEAIEAGLRSFRPHPSEAFYRRMAAAPWLAASLVTQRRVSMNKPSKFFKWAVPILVGLILVIGFVATPWGQALATEVFKLFVHTESNILPVSPEQLTQEAGPLAQTPQPITHSTLSVNELETQLGFDIKEPTHLPDLFRFQGILVYGRSVTFDYQCSCGGRSLEISQQPLSDTTPAEVGAGASIEDVQIGEVHGEYVEGAFIRRYPGTPVATWNSGVTFRTLRWVIGETLFQITSVGGSEGHWGYVDKEEMIAIAEGLK